MAYRRISVGYIYVLGTIAIWSGFILVSRVAGRSVLTFWDVTALRFGTAAILLLPLLYRIGLNKLLDRRMIWLAMTGGLGYALLAYAGFSYAPAAHAALLLPGMQPFFISIVAYWLQNENIDRHRRIGLALTALGVASMAFGQAGKGVGFGAGDLLFLSASFSWAIYSILLRRWKFSPWEATAGVAGLSAFLFLPIYLLFLPSHLHEASWSAIELQAGYQGVLVVIVAMIFFTQAVASLGAVKVGTYLAIVPALASVAAVPLLGESLSLANGIGLVLVASGALQPWRWRVMERVVVERDF